MLYLVLKAGLSGVIIALVSEVSRRNPGFGGLVASLPLVSILGMIWIWSEGRDPIRLADHAAGTLVFVLPSLPMFALMPWLLRRGFGFWPALAAGCVLTVGLYLVTLWVAPRLGVKL